MIINDFFLELVIVLFAARFLGEIAARFRVPSVIGELLAGVIIGPSLLGIIEPDAIIKVLAEIGVTLLLFEVGLETSLVKLAKTGMRAFVVAVGGVVIPFLLGFLISYGFFQLSFLISLFIGSTLTATSIGITMRVLTDLKRQKGRETQIVLGAAVLDDVIGIILLSIVFQLSIGAGLELFEVGKVALFIVLFLLLAPIAAKLVSSTIKHYERKTEIPGLLPTTIVSLILFFAWLAHKVGAPELLGGFAAGLALSPQFALPIGEFFHLHEEFSKKVETQMKPIIHLFSPIFFVTVGLSLDLSAITWNSPFIWILSISLLIVAIAGKLSSGFLLFKEHPWMKWAVGLAMIPRGEVGLIFADVGLANNILDQELYASLIIVIAITTLFTPFAMRYFYHRYRNSLE